MDNEIQSYINTQKSAGKSDEEIRSELLAAGWTAGQLAEYYSPRNGVIDMPKQTKGRWCGVFVRMSEYLAVCGVAIIFLSYVIANFDKQTDPSLYVLPVIGGIAIIVLALVFLVLAGLAKVFERNGK